VFTTRLQKPSLPLHHSPTSTVSSATTSPPQTPDDETSLSSRSLPPRRTQPFSAKWNTSEGKLSYSDAPRAPHLKGPPKLTSGKNIRENTRPKPTIASNDGDREPFAILGSRNPYYIGLPSPHAYDRFIQGPGEDVAQLRIKKLSVDQAQKPLIQGGLRKTATTPAGIRKLGDRPRMVRFSVQCCRFSDSLRFLFSLAKCGRYSAQTSPTRAQAIRHHA
jgi:hypothetical protein